MKEEDIRRFFIESKTLKTFLGRQTFLGRKTIFGILNLLFTMILLFNRFYSRKIILNIFRRF